MAPTTTLSFVRRDEVPIDPYNTFGMEDFRVIILGQPATPHRSVWTPAESSAFNLPILLFLIALCVVGAIMVFILWRWLPFFSDLHSNSSTWKDFFADPEWNNWYLKPAKILALPPHMAEADDAAAVAEDALAHLNKANTPKNQRQTARVKAVIASSPPACWGPLVRGCAAGTGEAEVGFVPVVFDAEKESLAPPRAHGRFANRANIDDSIFCTSSYESPSILFTIRCSSLECSSEYRSAFPPRTTCNFSFTVRIQVLDRKLVSSASPPGLIRYGTGCEYQK
ncbi:hypothetical protein C8R43DRAFT_1143889 [Mycena crocata]|nr:hypothetical protein C8R43DRAFT_1143889 [Mycena crocata]